MRICLFGEFYGTLDEAMRIISFNLAKELEKNNDVLTLDLRRFATRDFWANLMSWKPEVIHYIHGGSFKSFLLLKIAKMLTSSKTILSVMRFKELPEIVRLLRPDLLLAQSDISENYFRNLGFKTHFLPIGGVDVNRFNPKLRMRKDELREKYKIEKDKFVILHVGSIKKSRYIQIFKDIQKESPENQVVIVGAISPGMEIELFRELEKAGCIIISEYLPNIEEIYALADCYVFPVLQDDKKRNLPASIEVPLSVLEAMACNLPVITTKFGALPRMFKPEKGLIFINHAEEIYWAIKKVKELEDVNNRDKVEAYSWDNVCKNLESVYSNL
ncbi:MAG: glycosyltransferase family 4 protein [Archaeoglobaceae archaeon]